MSRLWAVVTFDGPDGPERHEMAAGMTQPGSPYLSVREAVEVESVTGMRPQQWMQALGEMDPVAWQALVMVLRRRAGVECRFSDVDFDLFSARMLDVDGDGNVVEPDAPAEDGQPAGN